jgi:hypothetical protein
MRLHRYTHRLPSPPRILLGRTSDDHNSNARSTHSPLPRRDDRPTREILRSLRRGTHASGGAAHPVPSRTGGDVGGHDGARWEVGERRRKGSGPGKGC